MADIVVVTESGIVTVSQGETLVTVYDGRGFPGTPGDTFDQTLNTTDAVEFAGLINNGLTFPTADGTAGQVIETDGAGVLTFVTPSGGDFLPLAGGTMTGNIVFDGTSGQFIGKGSFDTARSGNYGISIVCSVGYEFNWQAGWLVTTEQSSATPRPLYLDSLAGTTLRAWDSSAATGTEVTHLGITFADTTVQTTAYTGGAGVSSLTAGTGISLDVTTGDITVTNDDPDQTVTLTDGAGITITGTYPSFTIDCDITQYTDTDARLALSAGTGISYDDSTGIITNDEPDQTVTLTDGTGITVTGTYPSFTIDCDITQYTDTDARLALSAGTGISYDDTTGIITNDEPDQTVTLTGGTDIAVTGTYPSFTIDFDGVIPIAADADTAGILYGLTTDNVSGYNVSLGFGANGSLTTGNYNVALGGAAGDMTSGNYNIAIGFDCNVADPTADKQLAIGPDAYVRWLTGDANMNIKPGAGLKDAANSVGTAGQLLSSTGTAIEWVDSVTSLIAGTGISVDVSTGDVTITNDEPDQTVTLTDGTGITITGTYPSFTIDCDITQYTDTDARLALSAGTGITYDNTTGIVTNDNPDQTVTLTDGTGITVTGTYPSFTITNSLPDQTVVLTDGTDITITGTYPNFTIAYSGAGAGVSSLTAGTGISLDVTTGAVTVTNSEPDQTVVLTDGTGITVTGTYPSFTITSSITQYADADARLAISAGTGISYDNATGIITNDNPDQTVTLTDGADITITGTYPSFTIAYSGTPSSGTVTTASVVSANGFAGTVATDTTTPAITISTSITGILIGDGTAIAAATAGTDYVIPSGSITGSAASLSATLDITSGGTGEITATAAFNALAPSQASNSGKYLKTGGTNTSWETLPSALPVLLYGGVTTTNVSVANGSLPVLLFGGVTTINVTVT